MKDVAKRYGISSVPTFMVFEGGKVGGVEGGKGKTGTSEEQEVVDRVQGANAALLKKVVQALAAKTQD